MSISIQPYLPNADKPDEHPATEVESSAPALFQPWDTDSTPSVSPTDWWTRRGIWLGMIALLIGGLGQILILTENTRGSGVVLLVIAMLTGVVAWNGARSAPTYTRAASDGDARWWRIAWRPMLFVRLVGIAGAAWLAVFSILANMADPAAIFGLQGLFWLAGMALLVLSCARWYPRADSQAVRVTPAWERREIALFAALLALSLFTHLAWLDQLPWRLHFDEGFAYIETMRFYRGPAISLFTTTWEHTSLPSLWFGLQGLLLHITGPDLAGVRLGVALAGALTVIPVYALARLVWGRAAAGIAAFAMSVSAVYVHYSRVSILNVTTPFVWAICFYYLVKGLRSRRPSDFMWAGLAAGLSMYTYYGARLLPYLLLAFLAWLLVFHFRASRERMGHFALVAVGFLVGFGPLMGYFLQHPEMWFSRGLTILNVPPVIPTTWDAIVADWNIIAPLLWRNFLGLSAIPGRDNVYWTSFLLPWEAALLALGVGVLVWRWRQPASFLLLLWGFGVILTGGTLVDASTIPNFAHWTAAFPVFYLAMALPLALLWKAFRNTSRPSLHRAGAVLLALLLLADLGANAYAYIVQYPSKVPPDQSLEAIHGRYAESVEPNTHIRVVGNTWVWVRSDSLMNPIAEMMASPGSTVTRFLNPGRELPVVPEPGRNLSFVFYNDMYSYLPIVQGYYPGGSLNDLRSQDSTLVGKSYFLPSSLVESRYGVLATFTSLTSGDAQQWSGQVPTIGALPAGIELSYPLKANWAGAFYSRDAGTVKLDVQGGDKAALWVQGQPVTPGQTLNVEPGWVRFSLSAQLARPEAVTLLLQQSNNPASQIANSALWPMPFGQGLAATLSAQNGVIHRIDSFLGAGFFQSVAGYISGVDPDSLPMSASSLPGPFARWEGEVNTGEGIYAMQIRSDGSYRLTVDGALVVWQCAAPGNQGSRGQIGMTAGWHHIQLDFQAASPASKLEWFWTRPDGVEEAVPPAALHLAPNMTEATPIAWPDLPVAIICP